LLGDLMASPHSGIIFLRVTCVCQKKLMGICASMFIILARNL
jgi:hypothetical protein